MSRLNEPSFGYLMPQERKDEKRTGRNQLYLNRCGKETYYRLTMSHLELVEKEEYHNGRKVEKKK